MNYLDPLNLSRDGGMMKVETLLEQLQIEIRIFHVFCILEEKIQDVSVVKWWSLKTILCLGIWRHSNDQIWVLYIC